LAGRKRTAAHPLGLDRASVNRQPASRTAVAKSFFNASAKTLFPWLRSRYSTRIEYQPGVAAHPHPQPRFGDLASVTHLDEGCGVC